MNILATNIEGAESVWNSILQALNELGGSLWLYFLLGAAALVLVWGVYIGIRYSMANKQEDQIMAKKLIQQLVVGIIVIAVIAVACPLLIQGLIVWTGNDVPNTGSGSAVLIVLATA